MIKNYRPLKIIYEDNSVIVCDKPAGFAVQTAKSSEPDLVSLLKTYRQKNGERPYIGLVHRLDQPVRGLILFAKTPAMAARLSEQIAKRTMLKEYLAVLCPAYRNTRTIPSNSPKGTVPANDPTNSTENILHNNFPTKHGETQNKFPSLPPSGELHDYLLRDGRTNTSRVVPKGTPGAKKASLSYEVIQTSPETGRSLVHIHLHTGRHHQIRVQFANTGFPLYADSKYGQPLPKGSYCPIALCSYKIGFQHPETGVWMTFTLNDVEADIRKLL